MRVQKKNATAAIATIGRMTVRQITRVQSLLLDEEFWSVLVLVSESEREGVFVRASTVVKANAAISSARSRKGRRAGMSWLCDGEVGKPLVNHAKRRSGEKESGADVLRNQCYG